MDKARECYDGTAYQKGEVDYEPTLARQWPDFNTLYRAGFENHLHLYQVLLDAAKLVDNMP